MSEARYVRLKPYNKKAGHLVRRYHVAQQLFVGEDQSGNPKWYKVDHTVAKMLATKRQNHRDPTSPALFDVATESGYKATALRERDLRLVELGLASASAIASGPSHHAEAPLVDRSSGRADAVPGDIPSAAKAPAPPIKVEEIGPSAGELIAPPKSESEPEPEPESPIDPPHPNEAAEPESEPEPEPEAAAEEAPTAASRRRRPSGG